MLSLLRRRPFLLAGLLAIVLLVLVHRSNVIDEDMVRNLPGYNQISKLPGKISNGVKGGDDAAGSQTRLDSPLEDAHRLTHPDAFRPHFDAVARMPGLTLAEAESTCTWARDDMVNFQYGWGTEWAKNRRNDSELQARRTALHDFMKRGLVPWSVAKDKFKGRGIVTLGGNEEGKTFKRALVTLNQLKNVGCKLPVEVHHWGDELSDANRELLKANYKDIFFHDLSGPDNPVKIFKHEMPNFQFKIAAMLNSRFAEPFLLDSDNLALINPEELYVSKTYREYGTIFWPDIARTMPMNPIWAITNTQCRMDEYEQESGQLLIDKTKFWYHLQLSLYFLDKQDNRAYYRGIILGDKDSFRMAWHALKTKYGFPSKWLSSVGILRKADNHFCGHSFAQYHPDKNDGRAAFFHGGLLKTFNKFWVQELHNHGDGLFQVHKSKPDPYNHTAEPFDVHIDVMFPETPGQVPGVLKDEKLAYCTQFGDLAARPLDELAPDFESTFKKIKGYWVIEDA